MYGAVEYVNVNVSGIDCKVSVSQSKKTVWFASGRIGDDGDSFEVKDRSRGTAIRAWTDRARSLLDG
jgi:hypothetical protein